MSNATMNRAAGYNIDPYGEYLPYAGFYDGESTDKRSSSIVYALGEIIPVIIRTVIVFGITYVVLATMFNTILGSEDIFRGLFIMSLFFLGKFIRDVIQYSALFNMESSPRA